MFGTNTADISSTVGPWQQTSESYDRKRPEAAPRMKPFDSLWSVRTVPEKERQGCSCGRRHLACGHLAAVELAAKRGKGNGGWLDTSEAMIGT